MIQSKRLASPRQRLVGTVRQVRCGVWTRHLIATKPSIQPIPKYTLQSDGWLGSITVWSFVGQLEAISPFQVDWEYSIWTGPIGQRATTDSVLLRPWNRTSPMSLSLQRLRTGSSGSMSAQRLIASE